MFFQSRLYFLLFLCAITGCVELSSTDGKVGNGGKLINGRKEGEWKKYFKNGHLAEIANYKNDTFNGLRITYNEDGKVYTKAHYKMGVFVDSFILHFPNGQVRSASWFDSYGKEQGLYKIYYENGAISQIGNQIDGKLNDTIKTYHKNGQLMYIEFYENGRKEGLSTYFDEHGKPTKNEYYKNDSLIKEVFLNSR